VSDASVALPLIIELLLIINDGNDVPIGVGVSQVDNERIINLLDTVGTENQSNEWLPIVFFNTCCSAELRAKLADRAIACSCGHPGQPRTEFCVDYSVSLYRRIAAAEFVVETQKEVCEIYRRLFAEAYRQLECEQSLSYEISQCERPEWRNAKLSSKSQRALNQAAKRAARREVRKQLASCLARCCPCCPWQRRTGPRNGQQDRALHSVTSDASVTSDDTSCEPSRSWKTIPFADDAQESKLTTKCCERRFTRKKGAVLAVLAVLLAAAVWFNWLHRTKSTGCDDQPCKNGATCTASGGTHSCACVRGWKGADCSQSTGCDDQPCKNGATCTASGGTHSCACASGWKDVDCSQCDERTMCHGHGNCTASPGGLCNCSRGWNGTHCDMPYSVYIPGTYRCPLDLPVPTAFVWGPTPPGYCQGDCDLRSPLRICDPVLSKVPRYCFNRTRKKYNFNLHPCTTQRVTQLRRPTCKSSGMATCRAPPTESNLCISENELTCFHAPQICEARLEDVEGVHCGPAIGEHRDKKDCDGDKPIAIEYTQKSCDMWKCTVQCAGCYSCETPPGLFAPGKFPDGGDQATCRYKGRSMYIRPSATMPQGCYGAPLVCTATGIKSVVCPPRGRVAPFGAPQYHAEEDQGYSF
jgi:hypothetical protein